MPQNVHFTKSHIIGSLEKIGAEYGLQPELFKRETQHPVVNKNNFADLRHNWEILN